MEKEFDILYANKITDTTTLKIYINTKLEVLQKSIENNIYSIDQKVINERIKIIGQREELIQILSKLD